MNGKEVAEILWEVKAIGIDLDNPYMLVSGERSPIYIDCRRIVSFPDERSKITGFAHQILNEVMEMDNIDVIAGGETAGIPFAALLAQEVNLPMIYIRKKRKDHASKKQIEGALEPGENVLLYEDLITDGSSKLGFCDAVREAGADMKHCIVILDREQGGEEKLGEHGISLYSMTKLTLTLEYGLKKGFITEEEFRGVKEYLPRKGG